MREIKFRAWDKEHNLMCTSDIMGHWETDYLLDLEMTVWDTSKGLSFDAMVEDRFEFMQYTGLKDKNDKEIYEGDIIEAYGYVQKPKMVVKFDEKMAGFIPFIWKQAYEYVDYIGYFSYEDWCIIVGNIYENPELLKGGVEVV